jgi:NAD(P)H-nitrite reductase large subunit
MGEPLRYLIIGHGSAGLAAAKAIRRQDDTAKIAILTDEPHRFYSRPGLAYLLTGDIPASSLFSQPDEVYRKLRLSVLYGKVVELRPGVHHVEVEGGRRLTYDALLLATGAQAIRPKVPGIDLDGVVTLDNLDDTLHILKLARRTREAVVVGGGITALELAEGLATHAIKTHYFLRKDRYWSGVLDPQESAIVEHGLEEEGVQIHRRTEMKEIVGRKGRVRGVITEAGEHITCQMVAVAVGIAPRIKLARDARLEVDRGVLVDEYLRSSDPSIFAAGDVAQVYDPWSGKHRLDSLWGSAERLGRQAGLNMTGENELYERGIPFNVTRIGGHVTTIIGSVGGGELDPDLLAIMRGDSESWRDTIESFVVENASGDNRLRLVVGKETMVGAVLMGDQQLSRALQYLIREQVPLGRLRHILETSPQRAINILLEAAASGKLAKDLAVAA